MRKVYPIMLRCVKGFGGDFGQLAKIRYNWAGGWWLVKQRQLPNYLITQLQDHP